MKILSIKIYTTHPGQKEPTEYSGIIYTRLKTINEGIRDRYLAKHFEIFNIKWL